MSYDLKIWEKPAHFPAPSTVQEVARTLEMLATVKAGPNPKFVALAQKMAAAYPVLNRHDGSNPNDAVWLSDPVEEAQAEEAAIWTVSVPADDRVGILRFVVDQATALGLTAFDEQLGMGFLPSGLVLPQDKAPLWAGLKEEMETAPKRVTKAEVRKMMVTFVTEALKKHGFVRVKHKPSDAQFRRETEGGFQTVTMIVKSPFGTDPAYLCSVWCAVRDESVAAVMEPLFGANPESPGLFRFGIGCSVCKFDELPVGNSAQVRELLSLLETRAMPILDMARDLKGLDEVMNNEALAPFEIVDKHPRASRTMASYLRRQSLAALVTAWLASNPGLDEIVAWYRTYTTGRVDVSTDMLEKLLAYMCASPRGVKT